MKYPGVGAAVVIIRDSTVLLGKRPNGAGWGFPGGKVEMFETPVHAASRELYEESCLFINSKDLKLLCVMDFQYPNYHRHYVTIVYKYTVKKSDLILPRITKEMIAWKWAHPGFINPLDLTPPAAEVIMCLINKNKYGESIG